MQQFQIRKDNFLTQRLVDATPAANLDDGQIRLAIDAFSFTANNITYAAAGDQLGYWQFFPPLGEQSDGWGVIPVWGFADVIESRCPEIATGERLFGYFPPAHEVVMQPTRISAQHLVDGSAHRSALPAGYNSYSRVHNEPGYNPATEPERMLLWPLHITSFCIWDSLQDSQWHDAKQVIILSASSKTSIGLGYAMFKDDQAPATIGVTSARNSELVQQLGIYDSVVGYEQLQDIDPSVPTMIVDMSGNASMLNALHAHLGDQLRYCLRVGLTHWDETQTKLTVGNDRSSFFFAPGHIQKRMKDWGPQGFAERSQQFLRDAAAWSRRWLKTREVSGLQGLAEVYPAVCKGQIAADEGVIVTLGAAKQKSN